LPKSQQLVVTFAAGYIAGVFCAIVSHPADSVVSKLNSDVGSTAIQATKALGWKGTERHGCMCCYHCIYISGLWKGLGARILMIGTLTGLQWFIYDSVKVYFRMPRPPPPTMPESMKRKLDSQ